jgi:hypothetical protein
METPGPAELEHYDHVELVRETIPPQMAPGPTIESASPIISL